MVKNWLKAQFLAVYASLQVHGLLDGVQVAVEQGIRQARTRRSVAGQMGVLSTVLTLIIGAVAVYVGILVLGEVENALPSSTTNGSTFGSISGNVDSAFVLVGVGFIVLAAAFILTILISRLGGVGGMLGGGGGGRE